MVRQQTIDPKCAVARILSLEMNGNLVQGTFTPINTPLGMGYNAELLEGVLPAWSLRALGCLEVINGRNVVTNLKMVTYDSVVYPSHDVAYTQKIVSESAVDAAYINKNVIKEGGEIIPVLNKEVMSYIKNESANVSRILDQIDIFYESAKLEGNHVRLVAKNGDIFMVNLESYIQDEIANYCVNH